MNLPRDLSRTEHMVDVFDRASTLNFVVIARVRPAPTEARLQHALGRLMERHPLLGARITRGPKGNSFAAGAPTIPLYVSHGESTEVDRITASTLDHRIWDDDGPRAELHQVLHGDGATTLLLCLHHLVSDGSSGMLAMRDLLAFAADTALASAPLPSPGLAQFMPEGHGNLRWRARALQLLCGTLLQSKPYRLRHERSGPAAPRTSQVSVLQLDADALTALSRRARREGATVHGVLCAAAVRAVAHTADRAVMPARLLHPVDLRRYLRTYYPALPGPGEAVGYYVSSLETDHRVDLTEPLGALAKEISAAVRRGKEQGQPLLTAPLLGPWITKRVRKAGDLPKFRDTVERSLVIDTFGLTNLGPLEQLGVETSVGPYRIETMYFAAAGSVLSTLGAAASTLAGRLTLVVQWLEPLVSREEAHKVAAHFRAELDTYTGAAGGTAAPEMAFDAPNP